MTDFQPGVYIFVTWLDGPHDLKRHPARILGKVAPNTYSIRFNTKVPGTSQITTIHDSMIRKDDGLTR